MKFTKNTGKRTGSSNHATEQDSLVETLTGKNIFIFAYGSSNLFSYHGGKWTDGARTNRYPTTTINNNNKNKATTDTTTDTTNDTTTTDTTTTTTVGQCQLLHQITVLIIYGYLFVGDHRGSVTINFGSNDEEVTVMDTALPSRVSVFIEVHGTLMVLAWALMLPVRAS